MATKETTPARRDDDGLEGAVERRQTVRRMPAEEEIGPFFPSGMGADEAALAGATANMSDDEIAILKGEKDPVTSRKADKKGTDD